MISLPVLIVSNPQQLISDFLLKRSYTQLGVLVDSNTKIHCYPNIKEALPNHTLLEVSAGEDFKNLETCTKIWQQLTNLNFDRHSVLLVLGGGVLGDMGGFCAATFKRGIDFMLVPTTLLAQVDASLGGKLGIDFQHFKNHIGVFKEPAVTLICPSFLKTLPERELRSGYAEIIKHCLIADKDMWKIISSQPLNSQDWDDLIAHSVKIKQEITTQDPTEKGLRKILNFGHTIGHALETYYLSIGKRIFHGEAIAMGMIMESQIAHSKGLLTETDLKSISAYIINVFGKITEPFNLDQVMILLLQDKKNMGSRILMALLDGIGKAVWDQEVIEADIKSAIQYYQQL